MKKISVIVPCYNEEDTVMPMYEIVKTIFTEQLTKYDFEIIYTDDYSKDKTREIIRQLCKSDPEHVKAVFNAANFGFSRNVFSSLQMTDSDAAFLVFGDLQDPPQLLPAFIEKWETGAKVVVGQKKSSEENKFMCFMRKCYYKAIDILADSNQIKNFNGFGLYDQRFIEILRQIDDTQPFLKQVISEYVADYEVIDYRQHRSGRGNSNFNFYKNFDFAMEGITSSTKKLMRLSTFIGVLLGIFSGLYAFSVVIKKLLFWDSYPFGLASITCGIFFLGAMQLFFIGILGEYLLSVNVKTQRRPRIIIAEKINFGENIWQKELYTER